MLLQPIYAIESNIYVSNIIMQQYEVVILENAKELGRSVK